MKSQVIRMRPGGIGALIVAVILAFPTGDAAQGMAVPGKYKGKTGTRQNDGRISFNVSRNRKTISKLFVSAFVFCPRQNKFVVVATKTDNKKFKLRGGRRFTAKGLDQNGNRYKVTGKVRGMRKFSGKVELSTFSVFFNFFTGLLDGEACAGSRSWKASR